MSITLTSSSDYLRAPTLSFEGNHLVVLNAYKDETDGTYHDIIVTDSSHDFSARKVALYADKDHIIEEIQGIFKKMADGTHAYGIIQNTDIPRSSLRFQYVPDRGIYKERTFWKSAKPLQPDVFITTGEQELSVQGFDIQLTEKLYDGPQNTVLGAMQHLAFLLHSSGSTISFATVENKPERTMRSKPPRRTEAPSQSISEGSENPAPRSTPISPLQTPLVGDPEEYTTPVSENFPVEAESTSPFPEGSGHNPGAEELVRNAGFGSTWNLLN